MSRLADIYKSEKSKGGGLGSTLGKAALEKIDPRKMFDQKGLMAAMLPSMFKAYSATGSNKPDSNRASSLSSLNFNVSSLENQLVDISINTKMTAKNTMVMPMMARDVNITKLNIMKLVKLQGGKASKKSDMFWKDSAAREKEYESKFSKEKSKVKTSASGAATASAGKAGGLKGIGLDFLSTLMGGLGKGINIAAIGLGIGGFFAGLAAGGAAVTALGGAKGVKDMLVNLAEGLGAFSGQSMLAFGALLGAGMLFGPSGSNPASGALKGLNMSIGIASIGLGLGGFLAGLALGGAGIAALGGSGGVKQMMVDLAEGLNAFNPSSMAAFGTLLAAGGLFGVVTGVAAPAGLAMMGGTMLGMTAIGLGLGGFLAGLALGGKGIDMLGGGGGVKDMMVNLAEGLNAFGGLDAGNLAKLAGAIPAFGVGLLGFFGMQGIAGMVKEFTDGMAGLMNFIFGNKANDKSPMQQLAEDLKLFQNINGDNLSKVGQGFKDLASGLLGFAKVTEEDLAKASRAAAAGAALAKNVAVTTTPTAPAKPSAPSTTSTSPTADMSAYKSRAGVGREGSSPPSSSPMSPTKDSSTPSNTGSNGEFKSKDDFLKTMYPLAVEASKQLGGVDPNALLTQWGFESSWGSKTSGKYNYFGIKADKSWTGDKKDVMTHEFLNGEKVKLPQPFRSYNSPKEAVDDYVNFLKKNKRYEKAGVFQAKTSGEFFGALQKAGYATDPNYAAKLTSATEGTARKTASMQPSISSSGTVLASTSTSVADQKLALMSGSNGTTNIHAPTTNNNAGGGSNNSNGNIKLYNDALRNNQLSVLI
jgi:flagellar rod assembly protein/muramidase FlgJ